jgi:hypothetical protein
MEKYNMVLVSLGEKSKKERDEEEIYSGEEVFRLRYLTFNSPV